MSSRDDDHRHRRHRRDDDDRSRRSSPAAHESRHGDRSRSRERHGGRFDNGGHPAGRAGGFAGGSDRFPMQQGAGFSPMGPPSHGFAGRGGRGGMGPPQFAGGRHFGGGPQMGDMPGGRGMQGDDPGWRGRGGRFIPRGGRGRMAMMGPPGGRGFVPRGPGPGRGRGGRFFDGPGGRGFQDQPPMGRGAPGIRPPGFRPPPPPRREGDDPALVLRRKQSHAARISRQAAALKVSGELAGSKLHERWAAALHASDAAVDDGEVAGAATPYFADVLAASNESTFALADTSGPIQPLDVMRAVPDGGMLQQSKYGSFVLTAVQAADLALQQTA